MLSVNIYVHSLQSLLIQAISTSKIGCMGIPRLVFLTMLSSLLLSPAKDSTVVVASELLTIDAAEERRISFGPSISWVELFGLPLP